MLIRTYLKCAVFQMTTRGWFQEYMFVFNFRQKIFHADLSSKNILMYNVLFYIIYKIVFNQLILWQKY